MNWTKSQQDAINTDERNLLVSAGAGCGKTAILTNRIIRLMLENKKDINKFLVVTFTNAAASGMKEKIRKLLYDKLKDENSDKKFLFEQIANLENSNISTLHSFCISVIREYYHITDTDPSFQIVTDVNANILMDEAFEKLFEHKYEENDSDFISTSITYSFTSTLNEEQFKKILKNIYTFIYNRPNPFKWLHKKVETFNIDKDTLEKHQSVKIIKEHLTDTLTLAMSLQKQAYDKAVFFGANEKTLSMLSDELDSLKALQKNLSEDFDTCTKIKKENIYPKSFPRKTDLDTQIKDEVKNLRTGAIDIIKKISKLPLFSLSDNVLILKAIYSHMKNIESALIELDGYFKEIKREKGVLEFNDVEHLCLEILNDPQAKKEIQDKFDFVFVDEYQDTNLVQEAIINNIIKENNLFTVGDVKQSIYRFRQAEPEVFIDRTEKYKIQKEISKIIYMNKNFRTNKNVISAINQLFSNIMTKRLGKIDYDENEELIPGRKEEIKSKVEIHFFKEEENKDTTDIFNKNLTKAEKEIHYIALKINELLKNDIYDNDLKTYRKTQFSDICILSRSAKTKTKLVKEIFNQYSIPVNTESENEYFKTHEITIIKDFLSIINNFQDDLTLLSIMRSPIFNFNSDEILEIKFAVNDTFFHQCTKKYLSLKDANETLQKKIEHMLDIINEYKSKSKYMSVEELINDIYLKTSFMEYVKALPFGNIRQNNLKELLIKAKEYENFSNEGLYGFINFMEYADKNNSSSAPLRGNATSSVNFMTIHSSKGLEFPIVILMDTDKEFNFMDTTESIILNKDLGICPTFFDIDKKIKISSIYKTAATLLERQEIKSEEMRLFYVALTRAKEKLILTSKENLNKLLKNIPKEITREYIEKQQSYISWVLYVLLHDKIYNTKDEVVYEDENFIIYNKELSKLKNLNKEEYTNIKNDNTIDISTRKQIKEALSYKYHNIINTQIPLKAGVSSLKDPQNIEVGNNVITLKEEPDFMKEKQEVTAIQKGNIVHFILEVMDINEIKNCENLRNKIDEQIATLIDDKVLAKEDFGSIDVKYIYNFYESDIGKDLLNSNKIFRELPFNLSIPAKDITKEWADSDEDVLVQGIIDLTFEDKNGNMILVDYKTNLYKNEKEKELLVLKYKSQINYYKKAISTLMNKKVAHSYLYFLSKNEIVEV